MLGLNRNDGIGLFANIVAFVTVVLITNAFIFAMSPAEMSASRASSLTPPGFVIGLVWIGLFVCMAVLRWSLLSQRKLRPRLLLAVAGLMLCCAFYPMYTLGLHSLRIGIAANLLILAGTTALIVAVWRTGRMVSLWLLPLAIWLSYATVASYQQLTRAF